MKNKLRCIVLSTAMIAAYSLPFVVNAQGSPPTANIVAVTNLNIEPTISPTVNPTLEPTVEPTKVPEIFIPTVEPTVVPIIDLTEPTQEPTKEPIQLYTEKPRSNNISVDFTVPANDYVIPTTAVFELYSMDDTLLGTAEFNTNKKSGSSKIVFQIPEYEVGESFKLKLISGLKSIQYYDSFIYENEFAVIETYAYVPHGTTEHVVCTEFSMTAMPIYEKQVNIYQNGKAVKFSPRARLINGTLMVPADDAAILIGINDVYKDHDYNSVRVALASKEVLFNIGSTYSTVLGKDCYSPAKTQEIGGKVFVPLRVLAESFNAKIEVYDHGNYMDVILGYSRDIQNHAKKTSYVNSSNIKSQTDYLIWISKANYEVNVFRKVDDKWAFVDSLKCTIGTNSTPTCTGTYRYYEKIKRWSYPEFYVAPVMRFNGGYAIHSTLLKYDGTDYNRAVGRKSSHGCVRVLPEKMNWLIKTIPMYTTVHITEG